MAFAAGRSRTRLPGSALGSAWRDALSRSPRHLLLLIAGYASLALGLAGVALPLLPTTPFLLLAAYCFARSSTRARCWMLRNRLVGPYIRGYVEGTGISRRVKVGTIILLWVTLGITGVLVIDSLVVRVILAVVGIAVTAHLALFRSRNQ